ncbi:MAG: hypothetical protein JRF33_00605 [Deltaproteobacteria bacterium]|nr:hypothetical protein [Deltaproteobacteria bacterium]
MFKFGHSSIFIFWLLVVGCQWDVGTLEIRTVYSAVEGEKPFDPDQVDRIRVRVEGLGSGPREAEVALGEVLRVDAVPVGETVRVVIEGLGNFRTVSRGVTLPFEVQEGSNSVFVFTSQVGTSSEPPNVTSSKYPDWQERYRISMRSSRAFHQATVLEDGLVLVSGGVEEMDAADYLLRLSPGQGLRLAERFDPSAGAFLLDDPGDGCSARLCLASGRAHHQMVALPSLSVVLVVGGEPMASDADLSIESYASSTMRFQAALALNTPRSRHAMTALEENPHLLLVAGGLGRTGELLDSVELIDAEQGSVAEVGQLAVPRVGAMAVACGGAVLVMGGWEAFGTDGEGTVVRSPSDRIERVIVDHGVASVQARNPLTMPRAEATATLLADGKHVLICGGVVAAEGLDVEATASCDRVACSSDEVIATDFEMRSPRWAHRATLLPEGAEGFSGPEGLVLVTGGFYPGLSPAAYRSAEVINPAKDGSSRSRPSLKRARAGHSATLMPNGMVLILGGGSGLGDMPGLDYEIYNP